MNRGCYYCGAASTSVEHIPPLCLFPEEKDLDDGINYRKNLITVPSCDVHNSMKSKDDEYLLLILVHGYFNNIAGRDHFNSKVIRALSRRPAILNALYSDKIPVIVDDVTTVAVTVNRERFDYSLNCICQGLCYHQTGKSWQKEIEIYTPILLSINKSEEERINLLNTNLCRSAIMYLQKEKKSGENQDIFWYKLRVDTEKDRLVCQMVFYGGFTAIAISDPRLRDMDSMPNG